MARPKLPKDQVKETVGVKLTPGDIAYLQRIADATGSTASGVGREFLLLGMAVYRSVKNPESLLGKMLGIKETEGIRDDHFFTRLPQEPEITAREETEKETA